MKANAADVGYQRDRGDPMKPRSTLEGEVWVSEGLHDGKWPTPNAMDAERGAESRATKKARGAGGVNLREAMNQAQVWQTPTAADGGSTSRGGDRQGELLLGGQVRQWFTPQSRDWKDTSDKQGNRKSPNLGTQCHAAGPCHPDPSNGTGSPRASSKGSINAEWETALMGFPLGWLRTSEESVVSLMLRPKSGGNATA